MRLRRSASEAGQATAEFALVLPLLVFGLLGGADMARAFAAQLSVQNAARAGAEAAALGLARTDAAVALYARGELARTPGLDPSTADVSVTRGTGSSGERLVTVAVRYPFRTLVPWPLVPNSVDVDRATTMRTLR